MPTYALIGYPLTHSFSRGYFTDKFQALGLADTHRYLNFSIERVEQFQEKLAEYPDLAGCNVTIPHKRAILPLLDHLDPVAAGIGAVNTIRIRAGKTTGFNTDYVGFRDDLLEQLSRQDFDLELAGSSALVLGTGGASLAVRAVLEDAGVAVQYVSRSPAGDGGRAKITYADLDASVMARHRLIVNTTPLGMSPKLETAPAIPYSLLTPAHFCYDLIYNPSETTFLRLARGAGAGAANGLGMLYKQAEASWDIWNAE